MTTTGRERERGEAPRPGRVLTPEQKAHYNALRRRRLEPMRRARWLAQYQSRDEVAIERACRGERVPLTRVERWLAVRRLAARGLGPGQIADRLRMNAIQVRNDLTGYGWLRRIEAELREDEVA